MADLNGILAAVYDESNRALRISPESGPTGRELAVAESSAVQATTSFNSEADVTGLSITFTVGSRPVYVEAWLPSLISVTNTLIYTIKITDAANTAKQVTSSQFTAANQFATGRIVERISTPGEYTRKVRAVRVSGSGTLTNNFDATTVSMIRAIEA